MNNQFKILTVLCIGFMANIYSMGEKTELSKFTKTLNARIQELQVPQFDHGVIRAREAKDMLKNFVEFLTLNRKQVEERLAQYEDVKDVKAASAQIEELIKKINSGIEEIEFTKPYNHFLISSKIDVAPDFYKNIYIIGRMNEVMKSHLLKLTEAMTGHNVPAFLGYVE